MDCGIAPSGLISGTFLFSDFSFFAEFKKVSKNGLTKIFLLRIIINERGQETLSGNITPPNREQFYCSLIF